MRVPRRYLAPPNSTVHKIWRCHNREFLLSHTREKRAYLRSLRDDYREHCADGAFAINSFCVMDNHAHETCTLGKRTEDFSDHMRRAHGRFGLGYNRRHKRLGKVAADRPKTIRIQDAAAHMRTMFYGDCNPVRAGRTRSPTDLRWRDVSSCRFYAFGERGPFTDLLTPPEWYLALGKTPRARQRRYRSLLDRYMIAEGLRADPRMSAGHFIGSETWMAEQRQRLRERLCQHRATGPPDATPPDATPPDATAVREHGAG